MADLATLTTRLSEAETAYHKLMTIQQSAQVNVGGDSITYYNNSESLKQLNGYITDLKAQINALDCTQGKRRRAIGISFGS
ncbi:MAG: gpW family head-tail joining protein [Rhodospirillaceae bacterium]